jgi:hypothetical protein
MSPEADEEVRITEEEEEDEEQVRFGPDEEAPVDVDGVGRSDII